MTNFSGSLLPIACNVVGVSFLAFLRLSFLSRTKLLVTTRLVVRHATEVTCAVRAVATVRTVLRRILATGLKGTNFRTETVIMGRYSCSEPKTRPFLNGIKDNEV